MLKRIFNRIFLTKEIVSREGLVHFRRWRLVQTPWFAVYIHQISRSDEDPHMHSHPWNFRTFVLKGGYTELVSRGSYVDHLTHRRWSTAKHTTDEFHKITLLDGKPAWTLVITGPRCNDVWGYLTGGGIMDHFSYRIMRHPEDYRR